MLQSIRSRVRRQANRITAPYMVELRTRLAEQDARLAEQAAALTEARGAIEAVRQDLGQARDRLQGLGAQTEEIAEDLGRARSMLRHVYEEDSAQRRRLYALRDSEDYELAFSESEPLVSFVIPTYDRFESLRDVALPSILAQTYPNVEVVVAGDGSPPETEKVIEEFGDPRIRYCNRTVRGPYPADKSARWYMIGTPPYNDGVSLARGRWIASLGDDDAVRPEHTEKLLEHARQNRYEHCYGLHEVHYKSGETLEVGTFPPEMGQYVLQASIYHAGLRFFGLEPADYLYLDPNDWSLCRRMLAAGVRFGMLDRVVADKYESRYESHGDWATHGIPQVE